MSSPTVHQAAQGNRTAASSGQTTVLLVDDEPDILSSLGAFLGMELGWRIVTADSGRAALARMDADRIDIVVSDYRMPGMDGLELLDRVHQRAPGLPTVMVTAYPDTDLEATALRRGATRFLSKLASPDDLARQVRAAWQEGARQGAGRSPPGQGPGGGDANRVGGRPGFRPLAPHDEDASGRGRRPGSR